ncbi:hypothetical protein ALC57_12491 [Trachymyrmex cornetzi]|uniref:Uncharacterized protein n=1 Tax=Trachymyrmex cornetzi TaxID=471704 RepID=A0A195DRK8_9HYME|nr:hypothetical protein ALC57_12491 [Trachymyrmex cornetzi]
MYYKCSISQDCVTKQSTFVGFVDDLRFSAALLDYTPPFGRFSFLFLLQFLGGFLTQQQL